MKNFSPMHWPSQFPAQPPTKTHTHTQTGQIDGILYLYYIYWVVSRSWQFSFFQPTETETNSEVTEATAEGDFAFWRIGLFCLEKIFKRQQNRSFFLYEKETRKLKESEETNKWIVVVRGSWGPCLKSCSWIIIFSTGKESDQGDNIISWYLKITCMGNQSEEEWD